MSIKKELEDTLIERLSASLAHRDFQFVKAHRSWRKKGVAATFAFHLTVIQHPADFDLTADVAVRHEPLASLLEDLFGGMHAAAAAVGNFTVGAEIGNLTIGQPKRWTIATAGDVDPVAASILEVFDTVAQPYYRDYSDSETLLKVLSGDSRDCWIHAPLEHARSIRAVALAFLLGRSEQFDELIQRKRALLAMSKDRNAQRNLPVFEKVVEQLRSRWAAQHAVNQAG